MLYLFPGTDKYLCRAKQKYVAFAIASMLPSILNIEVKQENTFQHKAHDILNVLSPDNIALQRTGSMPR